MGIPLRGRDIGYTHHRVPVWTEIIIVITIKVPYNSNFHLTTLFLFNEILSRSELIKVEPTLCNFV